MPARRIEAGPLLALLGAIVLLVSLFLDWYAPGLSAWEIFELLDLVLAALAVAGGLAAVGALGFAAPGPESRHLPPIAAAAVVIVLATVLNHPPGVGNATAQTGLWLALGGALAMGIGSVLVAARVRISFDVEGRRRRVSAVDAREGRREPVDPTDEPDR